MVVQSLDKSGRLPATPAPFPVLGLEHGDLGAQVISRSHKYQDGVGPSVVEGQTVRGGPLGV